MTTNNDTKTHKTDALLDRAGRKAWTNKFSLEGVAAALFDDRADALSEFERSLMDNALRSLVRNVESRILTEMAQQQDAPKEFAELLERDGAASRDDGNGDAYPILEKAGVLRATGLIEVIKHRIQTHRLTLALRRLRRESSIASLMEEPQSSIIQSLLVAPAPESVDRLKGFIDAETDRMDTFQYPLIRPIDMPPAVMKQLCWWITAALRHYAITNLRMDPGMIDGRFERAATTVLEQLNAESSSANEADGVIDILVASGRFSPELLLQLLRQGEVSLFEAGFARITGLRKTLVSRLLYETGGESLAVACKAAGFDSAHFATIYGYTRYGRLAADAARNGKQDIIEFYDAIEKAAADAVLERWRYNADFLYAIKLLEQAE